MDLAATSPAIRPAAAATPLSAAVEWTVSDGPVAYADALAEMEQRVTDILAGAAGEQVWLLEHPALYTAGTSAKSADLLAPGRFPVFRAGRGGEFTYHGPGQRVAYVMLDLNRRGRDVHRFVAALEDWLIATLARLGVLGERRPGRVGVWVRRPEKTLALDGAPSEEKIAAIGIRLRRWVSFHGVSLNVDPDLEHYSGIVPCGVADYRVTSLRDLGVRASMTEVDEALRAGFEQVFGPTISA